MVRRVPNLQGGAQYTIEGKKYGPHAYVASRSGYYVWKNWDNWEENYNNAQVNTADKPVFKIEEVLLNYAEAMFETNQFTQTIADETINKLRKRAGVADMVVARLMVTLTRNVENIIRKEMITAYSLIRYYGKSVVNVLSN